MRLAWWVLEGSLETIAQSTKFIFILCFALFLKRLKGFGRGIKKPMESCKGKITLNRLMQDALNNGPVFTPG